MWSQSRRRLERHRDGAPAGSSEIDPAGGGTCRITPSYRMSNSSGGRMNRTSLWWVMAGALGSEGGEARERAAPPPPHPPPPPPPAPPHRTNFNQPRGPLRAPRPRSSPPPPPP